MFSKILIANRGEIACRIVKTARRMGIKTVAVYSEADATARHARLADEAVLIGPPQARESYLAIDKIIEAALRTGAEAVHPGYGFLSENEDFCRACENAGIVFIGPPPRAIRVMGSKSESKKLMERAGVPLTPGYHGDNQDPGFLCRQADSIGYPVLIKASAGGGGKGMRVVRGPEEFLDALASCQREAAASFGDDHVLIEKYLTRPRHIEMQVFADKKGNCIHLFERDCSVQRRHQKVIEEAPAPGMTNELRRAMGKAVVEAAMAVGYVGAGTVEFIVSPDGPFYFMEMNTRLQVEHPITEMITGLDLVEWQFRIAAGEALPLNQEQVVIRGHAIEARIYAEDPEKGFLPSSGKLTHLEFPRATNHLRIDTGVEQGDTVTPYYDPMIAKLIVWDGGAANARRGALNRMLHALADFRMVGVANNIDFLSRLVACPAFVNADLDTGLIERETSFLFSSINQAPREVWLVAAVSKLLEEKAQGEDKARRDCYPRCPWHLTDGWRINGNARRTLKLLMGEFEKTVTIDHRGNRYALQLDGRTVDADGEMSPSGNLVVFVDGQRLDATVIGAKDGRHIFYQGRSYVMSVVDPLCQSFDAEGVAGSLTAPMPGKVIALIAKAGDKVAKGAPLLVLEAMKMEHIVVAPTAGTIRSINYDVGDQVTDGSCLVEFQDAE